MMPAERLSPNFENETKPFPTILVALGLLLLIALVQIFLSIPLLLIESFSGISVTKHPASVAVINAISIGVILLWGLRKTKTSFNELYPLTRVKPVFYLAVAVTVVGVGILLSEVDNLLRTVLPMPDFLAEAFETLLGKDASLWGAILAAVVVAPLSEELLFRGLILRGFLKNYGTTIAIIVSAFLFGVFHLNPWQFTGAFVAGILFAWWFVETKSLSLCIFAHALHNGMPIIVLKFLQLEIPGYTSDLSSEIQHQPMWFNLMGLILAAVGIWWLLGLFREEREERKLREPFAGN